MLGAVGGSAPVRLVVELVIFVLAYALVWLSVKIWRRARDRSVAERVRIVAVHLLCCATDAIERVRLQLGGTSRRT